MKKIQITILGLIAIMLFSCNPNKEIYDELDALEAPYNETFSYELTDDDYDLISSLALAKAETAEDSAIANGVGDFHSFSDSRQAALLVPDFIEASFIALDSASAISVHYKFDYQKFIDDDHSIDLTDDTLATGADPDYSDTIPHYINEAAEGDLAYVKFVWDDGTDDYETRYNLYKYDGSGWVRPDNVIEFNYEQFESMNQNYHNFSDDADPAFYIPVFMETAKPYAVAGDEYELFYKYYEGGGANSYRYNKVFFDGNSWSLYANNQDQFIHSGEKWVFDPTVSYYLQKPDFQLLVDWVAANDTINGYLDLSYPDNTEGYFGASAYYGNFDMRQSARIGNDPNGYYTDLSTEEIDELLYHRLTVGVHLILNEIFPDAQPFSNGVPVYYEISFDVYNGKHVDYMIKYLCTDVGTFEYVEGPTAME